MKQALLIIAVVLFVVAIIIYPFKVKGLIYANLFNGVLCFSVVAFKIKLLNERICVSEGGSVFIEKSRDKKEKDKSLGNYYFALLAKRADLDRVAIFFDCGKSDDASFSSLACGAFNIAAGILYHLLLEKYGNVKFLKCASPVYDRDIIELSARLVIRFSLLDMLLSFVCAYLKYIKVKGIKNGK